MGLRKDLGCSFGGTFRYHSPQLAKQTHSLIATIVLFCVGEWLVYYCLDYSSIHWKNKCRRGGLSCGLGWVRLDLEQVWEPVVWYSSVVGVDFRPNVGSDFWSVARRQKNLSL